jgi:peptidoglycan/LPS O-acetylase OafA/YrhL
MTRLDHDRRRRITWLMLLVAASLAVMATLHLTGTLTDDGKSFDKAGIPEALIGVALLAGAWSLARGRRSIPVASLVFAIAGFLLGLTFTIPDGKPIEITYHLTVLPLLVGTLLLLVLGCPPAAADTEVCPTARRCATYCSCLPSPPPRRCS